MRVLRLLGSCLPGARWIAQMLVLACALLAALLVWAPHRASAQLAYAVLAGEGDFNLPIKAPYAANGPGFAARLGTRIGLPGAQQIFEFGFDYASFGEGNASTASGGVTEYRGIGGMRLSLDGIVKPGLFMHAGAGHVNGKIAIAGAAGTTTRSFESLTHTAFTWDGGAYLDIALTSFLELGIQGSYTQIIKTTTARSFQWLALGAHLQFVM